MIFYGPSLSADAKVVEQNMRQDEATIMGTLPEHSSRTGPCPQKPTFHEFVARYRAEHPKGTATREEMFRAWKGVPSFGFRSSFVKDAFEFLNLPKEEMATSLPERQIEFSRESSTNVSADVLLGQLE